MSNTFCCKPILANLGLIFVGLTGSGSIAHAQQVSDEPVRDASLKTDTEIIVVARRREENLQEVPVSITAFGSADIETQTIRTIQDFSLTTPSFQVSRDVLSPSGAVINLRGQNQPETQINGDPAVGIYADGVYMARNSGMLLNMVDVERVEVLKGPQGTLFGRNSTGGALNITTRKPQLGEFSGEGKLLLGNYGRNDYAAILNVPLDSHSVAARLVFQSNNSDSYWKNSFDDADLDDDKEYSIRGTLRFQPDNSFDVIIRGDYSKADEGGVAQKLIWVNPRGPGETATGLADPDRVISFNPELHGGQLSGCTVTILTGGLCNFPVGGVLIDPTRPALAPLVDGTESLEDYLALPPFATAPGFYNPPLQAPIDAFPEREDGFSQVETWGVSLTATKEFESVTMKAVIAYREMDSFFNTDVDGTPFPIVNSTVLQDQKQFSGELQVSGVTPLGGRDLDWVAGLFYFNESGLSRSDSYALDPLNPFNPSVLRGEAENTSIAGFMHAIYPFSDSLNLSAGIRYTEDQKDLVGGPYFGNVTGVPFICNVDPALLNGMPGTSPETCLAEFSDTFDAISWDFSLDYRLIEESDRNLMAYAKIAKGFRSGGQNLNSVFVENSYKEENVLSYEAGIKSDWLDNHLRLNLAFYLQDYKDIQLVALTANETGSLSTKFSNAADATIKGLEFEMAAAPVDNLTLAVTAAWTDAGYDKFLEPTADPDIFNDRSDELFQRIPDWTYSIHGTYVVPFDSGDLTISGLWAWQDQIHFSKVAYLTGNTQPSVGTLDARISFELHESGLTFALWGKNLTDKAIIERTVDFSNSLGHVVGLYRPPLTWGGEIIWRFGE
jgi:iron complex outermembrane receptor protein